MSRTLMVHCPQCGKCIEIPLRDEGRAERPVRAVVITTPEQVARSVAIQDAHYQAINGAGR